MATSYARSPFSEIVHHLLQLHFLDVRGMNDSTEADEVRDLMDDPWRRLNKLEESRVDGLSADLYSIGADRSAPARVGDEYAGKLSALQSAGNWDGVLAFLREYESKLPPADVARLRGIIWKQFGEPAVAVVFFHEAVRIAPQEPINEVLELQALMAAERMDDAVSRAKAIQNSTSDGNAIRLLGASSILFQAADTKQCIDRDLLQLSIDAADRGLKLAARESPDDVLREMCRSAYLRLGLGYFWQHNQPQARAACEQAVKLAPDDRNALILLAWIEREESPDLADEHFRHGFLPQLNLQGGSSLIQGRPLTGTET